MSIRIKPIFIALSLAGFAAVPVLAVASSPNSAQLNKLSAQINQLQKEVNALKKNQRDPGNVTTSAPPVSATIDPRNLRKLISEQQEYLPFDLDVPGQAFVSTGPYVGVPLQFAGNNLIVNSPSVNVDVTLLSIRKKISEQLHLMGGEIAKEPYHSHLLLSGVVEAQANYFNQGGSPSTTDINVSNFNLDAFFIGPSNWTLGFVELGYVDSTPANDVFVSSNQYRVANSRVFVNKAFRTLEDYTVIPFYGSFGQYFVPYGEYSTSMVSTQFTRGMVRKKSRAIVGMARALVEKHNGEVPASMEALVLLPGVGRKTANVVLGHALGVPGLPVDRHVLRVANRIGLVKSDDAEAVETALCSILPPERWTRASDALILHGRRICRPAPVCDRCHVRSECAYYRALGPKRAPKPAKPGTRRR